MTENTRATAPMTDTSPYYDTSFGTGSASTFQNLNPRFSFSTETSDNKNQSGVFGGRDVSAYSESRFLPNTSRTSSLPTFEEFKQHEEKNIEQQVKETAQWPDAVTKAQIQGFVRLNGFTLPLSIEAINHIHGYAKSCGAPTPEALVELIAAIQSDKDVSKAVSYTHLTLPTIYSV